MNITLPTGLTLSGTETEVLEAIKKMGYPLPSDKYYYSESKGEWLEISKMAPDHMRNAILKIYKNWVEGLRTIVDPEEFVRKLMNGNTDPTFVALLVAYKRSKDPNPFNAYYSKR